MATYTIEDSYHPLVSAVTSRQASELPSDSPRQHWLKRQNVFPKSKALMILAWNIMVGATYAIVITGGPALVFSKRKTFSIHMALYSLLGGVSGVRVY